MSGDRIADPTGYLIHLFVWLRTATKSELKVMHSDLGISMACACVLRLDTDTSSNSLVTCKKCTNSFRSGNYVENLVFARNRNKAATPGPPLLVLIHTSIQIEAMVHAIITNLQSSAYKY